MNPGLFCLCILLWMFDEITSTCLIAILWFLLIFG
jgi:hypothetical protein